MPNKDKYSSFAALEAGEDPGAFDVLAQERPGGIAVIAPHGGAIEPSTSEIARAIARHDLSLYLFEGNKPENNKDLHITSSNFDEPKCLGLIADADVVVAVHGEGNAAANVVYMGGLDQARGAAVRHELTTAGFTVERHVNPDLQGLSSTNICNRGRSNRGVQLELSSGLRLSLFASLTRKGRTQPTARLQAFAAAVRRGLGVVT